MPQIVATDDTLHGKPRIEGTRVLVRTVYALYQDGLSVEEIAERYPSVTEEGVRKAIEYAGEEKVW